jgi:hypothetical protein
MNTYQEKLFLTVNETLVGLRAQRAIRISQENCDEFSVYYAQGARYTSQNKLDKTSSEYDAVHAMNEQTVTCNSQSDSLIVSTNLTDKSIKKSAALAQKSAEDIQLASNTVAHLAADIGSALNIVFAADYGSDIAEMTKNVNHYIREAAYSAENTAQKALEAATAAAEITPGQIKDSTNQTSKSIKALLKETTAQTVLLSTQKEAELIKYSDSINHEKSALGALQNAKSLTSATNLSFALSNREMNLGLDVVPISESAISVNFHKEHAGFSGGDIPKRVAGHYIVLVKAEKRQTFNPDAARTLYESSSDRFTALTSHKTEQVDVNQDADGHHIKPAYRYVAFLFTELTPDYKKYIGDQDDFLSAATDSFVFKNELASPVGNLMVRKADGRAISATLVLDNTLDHDIEARLLCVRTMASDNNKGEGIVLLDAEVHTENNSLTAGRANNDILMTSAIAETVAMSGYQTATKTADKEYQFLLPSDLTDNFSFPIIQGASYRLAIFLTASAGNSPALTGSALYFPDIEVPSEVSTTASQTDAASKSGRSSKNKK